VALGVFGASLFYGDGIITPAISVLSAVEGIKVAAPSLGHLVAPITLTVLTALFVIQRYGTGLVGKLFGPVMVVWFAALAAAGVNGVAKNPTIVKALSPTYGAQFIATHGPFRATPDHPGLVLRGVPGVDAELPGAGRCDFEVAGGGGEPVFPDPATLGAGSDGGAGHRCDDHRVAVGDLRGV